MRRVLVAGNWKMNTTSESSRALASALVSDLSDNPAEVDVLVCPPFPYLASVREVLDDGEIKLGAQDCWFESPGAYTGEVAIEMLLDCGCQSIILGHSERRHVIGETDGLINKKVIACLERSVDIILCVGELLSEREVGQTEEVL